MKQEKKLDLAIMEIAKTISKYKVHGLVVLGYPDRDHGVSILAGDAKFACSVLASVVSDISDRLNDDDKRSFLRALLMEILDENEKIHIFKDPKYEN
ncbi:hypothetical protein [Acidaminococcus timonensis]|uniref:hypothetical protein n=1 Tax=Acidaminococcus timonensis TaxID=1871002 RepID=UPI00307B78AF